MYKKKALSSLHCILDIHERNKTVDLFTTHRTTQANSTMYMYECEGTYKICELLSPASFHTFLSLKQPLRIDSLMTSSSKYYDKESIFLRRFQKHFFNLESEIMESSTKLLAIYNILAMLMNQNKIRYDSIRQSKLSLDDYEVKQAFNIAIQRILILLDNYDDLLSIFVFVLLVYCMISISLYFEVAYRTTSLYQPISCSPVEVAPPLNVESKYCQKSLSRVEVVGST